jgi:hypothetical protein
MVVNPACCTPCCAPCCQIADGYFVKYFASCVALVAYALPLYFTPPGRRGSQGQLTADYIRSMRLLQNTSRGIGDLILVYKRVSALAGHTGRVAELLEQVRRLGVWVCGGGGGLCRRGAGRTQGPDVYGCLQLHCSRRHQGRVVTAGTCGNMLLLGLGQLTAKGGTCVYIHVCRLTLVNESRVSLTSGCPSP